MNAKKIILWLVALAMPSALLGQTVTTATVVDTDGTAWANAPYTISFVSSQPGQPSVNGQPFTLNFSGTLNSSGQLSVTLTDVATVYPPNGTWNFCLTPTVTNPTTACTKVPVTGASENVSTQLNAAITAPRLTGGRLANAYADVEVAALPGNMYFRVSDTTFRCYTTGWSGCGGSGTFSALSGDATSTATGGATEVIGLENHLLPSLTTGYLNWTGSAWALSAVTGGTPYPSGSGIPIVASGTSWGTTVAAPAGTVVGTTDTQTLTNKTVDGVAPATFVFLDPTSSVQTQLNAKAPTASPTFTGTATTPALDISGITGLTQCLQASSAGVVSGTGSACGSSSSGITGLTGGVTASGTGSVAATVTPTGIQEGTGIIIRDFYSSLANACSAAVTAAQTSGISQTVAFISGETYTENTQCVLDTSNRACVNVATLTQNNSELPGAGVHATVLWSGSNIPVFTHGTTNTTLGCSIHDISIGLQFNSSIAISNKGQSRFHLANVTITNPLPGASTQGPIIMGSHTTGGIEYEDYEDNVTVAMEGSSTNLATCTLVPSTGAPTSCTIGNSGGSNYHYPFVDIHGCSVQPTPTVTTSGTFPNLSIASVTFSGGTCTGTTSAMITDVAGAYGVFHDSGDGGGGPITLISVGTVAGMYANRGDNFWTGGQIHCYGGQPACINDQGDNHYPDVETDGMLDEGIIHNGYNSTSFVKTVYSAPEIAVVGATLFSYATSASSGGNQDTQITESGPTLGFADPYSYNGTLYADATGLQGTGNVLTLLNTPNSPRTLATPVIYGQVGYAEGSQLQFAPGTTALPSLSWLNSTTGTYADGIYQWSSGDIRISTQATDAFRANFGISADIIPATWGLCWGTTGVLSPDSCVKSASNGLFSFGSSASGTGATLQAENYQTHIGASVASSNTIAPVSTSFHLTGTTPVETVTPLTGMSSTIGGTLFVMADAASSTITGGNILNAVTFSAGNLYIWQYDGTNWYIQNIGGGSGNTTSTTLASGFLPKANGANSIINSGCDEGITTANVFTCSDTAGASFQSKISVTGTGNGALNLTSTGTGATGPSTSTVQITVPNSVTAYTITVPGAAPTGTSFASTTTGGIQSWVTTIPIANGGTNAASAAAGTIPNATSGTASAWTATPTLGAAGTLGSLTMGNATSGLLTIAPVTGALGTVTASFPANTGTIAELNLAQTFSAVQTISAANGLVLSAMTGTACLEEVSGVVTSTGSACGSGGGITFPQTVAGTTISGGIPYFSNTTTLTASDAIFINNAGTTGMIGFNQTNPLATFDYAGTVNILNPSLPGTITISGAGCTATSTTCTVTAVTGLPANGGLILFDNEIAAISSASGTTITFNTAATGCSGATPGRGCYGSTAAAHGNGVVVAVMEQQWSATNLATIPQMMYYWANGAPYIHFNPGSIPGSGASYATLNAPSIGTGRVYLSNQGTGSANILQVGGGVENQNANLNAVFVSAGTGPSRNVSTQSITATSLTAITGAITPAMTANTSAASNTVHGMLQSDCTIMYQQATALATVQFGVKLSAAPTDLYIIDEDWNGATLVGNPPVTLATTTATATSGSITPTATATTYYSKLTLILNPGTTNAPTVQLYGLTSVTGDGLTIEPGTGCTSWH